VLPAARSRAAQFDDLVLDAVERVSRRWGAALQEVEVAVEDVPPAAADEVSLSRAEPATADRPARIVVHRRPVEARATGARAREDLVHDAVVDAVADLLGMSPDDVDPDRDDDDSD
jgi:predicted Zn-dependent protease with MMP-like domain